MGRISASNARGMYNAYSSVYEGYGKKKEGGCVDKEDKGKHNCAKKVCHEQFGEGTCIFGEHAVPDENGFVSHYDVMFEHGVERNVPVEDMEVLVLVEHPMEGHRYEGEQLVEYTRFADRPGQPVSKPNKETEAQRLAAAQRQARETVDARVGRASINPATGMRYTVEPGDVRRSEGQAAVLGGKKVQWSVDKSGKGSWVPRYDSEGEQARAQLAAKNAPKPAAAAPTKPAKPAPVPAKPTSAKPAPVLSMKNGVTGTGVGDKFVARKWTDAERARYTASGGKVSTTAKPAPANTTPASGDTKPTTPTGATVADKKPAVPAAKPLSDVGKMIQASQMRQKGANVTSDMISDKSVKAPAPKPQLSARAQALKAGGPKLGPRERMLNQDLDLFDIVKGHLMSEGYADTEEAALAIMANMSEEWKQSILDEEAPKRIQLQPANRRLMKDAGPARVHDPNTPKKVIRVEKA